VEGLAFHWPGMDDPISGRRAVAAALRGWQDYHIDGRGWSDIAYQVAIDQDGDRWTLRGLNRQSGANGDADLNRRFGAVLLILAPGERPTPAMVAEVRRVVRDHRRRFPRSRRLVGHGDIRPGGTACPGPIVSRLIESGAFEPRRRPTGWKRSTPRTRGSSTRCCSSIGNGPVRVRRRTCSRTSAERRS
jgi:hypothetical protein